MNAKVDDYIAKATRWQEEFEVLRSLVLDCQLTEDFKWGCPCYTFQKNNVVIIHGFKEYCALLFVKGSLLQDTHGLLIQQTENVQAGRQIRFSNVKQITEIRNQLKAYIYQAIEVERLGLKVEFNKDKTLQYVEEFQQKMDQIPELKTAYEGLTPGRQRAYHLFFSAPKQSQTRVSRIEKCIPQILLGKGLND